MRWAMKKFLPAFALPQQKRDRRGNDSRDVGVLAENQRAEGGKDRFLARALDYRFPLDIFNELRTAITDKFKTYRLKLCF